MTPRLAVEAHLALQGAAEMVSGIFPQVERSLKDTQQWTVILWYVCACVCACNRIITLKIFWECLMRKAMVLLSFFRLSFRSAAVIWIRGQAGKKKAPEWKSAVSRWRLLSQGHRWALRVWARGRAGRTWGPDWRPTSCCAPAAGPCGAAGPAAASAASGWPAAAATAGAAAPPPGAPCWVQPSCCRARPAGSDLQRDEEGGVEKKIFGFFCLFFHLFLGPDGGLLTPSREVAS